MAAFLVLLGVVWYLEWRPGKPAPKATTNQLFHFRSSDVQRVAIAREGTVVEIARQGNEWVIRRPLAQPADRFKAEGLVSQLASLIPTRSLGSGFQGLDTYGLAKPDLTVEVEAPAGRVHKLLVGAQNPEKTGYYVKTDESGAVYLIADDVVKTQFIGNLEKPPQATPSPSPPASPRPSP